MDKTVEMVNLLSDISLGGLALWQGIRILSDVRLKTLEGLLPQDELKKTFWYKTRKFDQLVLMAVIIGFAIAVLARIYLLVTK
jgi:hypothetical protein